MECNGRVAGQVGSPAGRAGGVCGGVLVHEPHLGRQALGLF